MLNFHFFLNLHNLYNYLKNIYLNQIIKAIYLARELNIKKPGKLI